MTRREEILVLVKTYPVPSQTYGELVCVAGVTRSGEWRRIYPVNYRRQLDEDQFAKYQWIAVETSRPKSDNRPESRTPDLSSIRTIGAPLSAEHSWAQRRAMVDRLSVSTMEELIDAFDRNRTSLGVVTPETVFDIEVNEVADVWSAADESKLQQMQLFDRSRQILKRIQFEFRIVFKCYDAEKTYRAKITDWEAGMLYLNSGGWAGKSHSAAEAVRSRYLEFFQSDSYDSRLFMGTVHPFNTWIAVGVFYPPSAKQGSFL